MDHKEFYTALSKQALPSVLLFEGEEEHLKQDALSSLRRSILPEGLEQLNEILLEDPLSDELIAAAETLPFMSEKRLLIIRDYSALSGRSEADDKINGNDGCTDCWQKILLTDSLRGFKKQNGNRNHKYHLKNHKYNASDNIGNS